MTCILAWSRRIALMCRNVVGTPADAARPNNVHRMMMHDLQRVS